MRNNLTAGINAGALGYRFWLLAAFIALVFLMGGSSRSEAQSLILLRPMSVILCGIALLSLERQHLQSYRIPLIFAVCLTLIPIFQLLPLPAMFVASSSAGDISEIDKIANLSSVSRVISVAPSATKNSLFSLFIPWAVLLLGMQLSRDEKFALLPLVLGFGLLSAFMGVLQIFGDPSGPLYLYETTNRGASVGLFANRNHQALLLAMLLPILFVYLVTRFKAEHQARLSLIIAIAVSALLILLILIVGSRAGLLLGLIALVVALALYRQNIAVLRKRSSISFKTTALFVAGGLLALTFITIIMARAEAFDRLLAPDQLDDLRFQIWGPILGNIGNYLPFGSGAGSFATVYREQELDNLLISSYVNQAHNDILDVPLTMGVPGMALAIVFLSILAANGVSALRAGSASGRQTLFRKLGLTMLLLTLLSSATDYPLRTPIFATVAIIAILWIFGDAERPKFRATE